MLCNVCQCPFRQPELMLHMADFIAPEARTAMQFLAHESAKTLHIKVCEGQKCWKCSPANIDCVIVNGRAQWSANERR